LLALARQAICEFVLNARFPETSPSREGCRRCGAFVTLHVAGRLRGCIGRPESPDPLDATIAECAILAATRDARFAALQPQDLENLHIEISVLSPPEDVPAADVIDRLAPGTHGVTLSQGAFRGLLLPQVAAERGWDAQRFLEETCRKAGLPRHAWRDPETHIELFTAEVFSETVCDSCRPRAPN
jgi:AmmeMemoRadiSam system protein A